jgi:uncharacterized cupredoxin-like copper-binding protein
MVIRGILGVIAVLGVVSAVMTVANFGGVSAAADEGATIVTAKKTEFDVESIEGRAGQEVRIVVKNKDPFLHTFTIDDLDIDQKVSPGGEELIEFEAPAGSYEFICRIVGHEEDMKGTLTIR